MAYITYFVKVSKKLTTVMLKMEKILFLHCNFAQNCLTKVMIYHL